MSLLEKIAATAGRHTGRQSVKDFALIRRNFAKLEPSVNDQVGLAYTLAATDAGKVVLRSNASAQTCVLPKNATAAIPISTQIPVIVSGAGTLTFSAESGATVIKLAAKALTVLTGGRAVATKISTNGWELSGDLG